MDSVKKMIRKHNTMTIATSRKDNSSAATVFYAPTNKGDSLIFVSSSKSEHILNSKINPNCAAAINKDGLEWEKIKGLQLKGKIELAEQKHWKTYFRRYPQIQFSKELTIALGKVDLYLFKISWIRLIDNSKNFGDRKEFNL